MFSKSTILQIVKAVNLSTHNEVDEFAITYDLENVISGQYIKEKETSIAKYLIANPNMNGPNDANLQYEILEAAIKRHKKSSPWKSFDEQYPDLLNSLKKDGYKIEDDNIRQILPSQIPLVSQESELENLLTTHNFNVAKGHYDQAIAAHGRGDWAASNAQLRSFVEELFNELQSRVCPGSYTSSQMKKQALAQSGFFIGQYNEFLSNGTGFVEGFWKRLHPSGSHPGLSEESDSTFRLELIGVRVKLNCQQLYRQVIAEQNYTLDRE
ncbi:MAG: hypothetical protein U9N34_04400 [Candidatus Cloacimonadota bacterium]|nr:hypothetical protein [Candidatus Cloacimonadota bacterium]